MKKLFLGFTGLIFLACTSDASRIGADFFKDGALDVSFIDSSTVRFSTVKFDSLITSKQQRVLIGSHLDEKLGRITACTYLLPGLGTVPELDYSTIVFDGLSLVMKYDGYSYYDTASSLTLHAYQVSQNIELSEDGNLYNTSHFPHHESPLGSTTVIPKPHFEDSVEIALSPSFGESFYTRLKEDGNEFSAADEFTDYIKGFVVMPDTTMSSGIIGFSSQADLRLYYFDKNEIPAERRFISFPVNIDLTSTHIKANRTHTKLKPLSSYNYSNRLSALETDNESYLQAGAGLALRVDLPYLRNLKEHVNFYVTRAVLEIYPVHKSYDKFTVLPATLVIYEVDKYNGVYREYSSAAYLNEDLDLDRDTRYEVDVTEFVKAQMEIQETNENALLLLLADESFRMGMDRVYFAGPGSKHRTRLKIYYASIMN